MSRDDAHTRPAAAARRPRITLLHHYQHPDDVVSARLFDDLAVGLTERGWDVTAMPCQRGCHDEGRSYPLRERWRGVDFRRVWRPRFPQSVPVGRAFNAAWMMGGWTFLAPQLGGAPPDVILVGSDPPLSVLWALLARRRAARARIVHWVHDLYPEAPIADGSFAPDTLAMRALRRALTRAYGECDLVVDLGSCMRRRIASYGASTTQQTIPPWALVESADVPRPDPELRRELFGDARLGVLYSGNLGRAHSYRTLLELARRLRGSGVVFCFAVRGHRAKELEAAVTSEDTNVQFRSFVDESRLAGRLAAADVHLASLSSAWTGVVVPSKFAGSLALGRPVVFAGSGDSAIAEWIERDGTGWLLNRDTLPAVQRSLLELARDPTLLTELQRRCHRSYQAAFSRERALTDWDAALRGLL